jgi:hypothetical protein
MTINRRRAPSSKVSSEKKLGGHTNEAEYAALIGGSTIKGTGKGDVKDKSGKLHSVKSGKKWQVFLYRHDRIENSKYLSELRSCLDAFTKDYDRYVGDRTKCIELKEFLVEEKGRDAVSLMSNDVVKKKLGPNEYVKAKERLAEATHRVCRKLQDKAFLKQFLAEALFNGPEVSYLAVKDGASFRVFSSSDVLRVLTDELSPANSRAGHVPEDYNVDGQKVLLRYSKGDKEKNIVEIEIRNDSEQHYREVRFNMFSKDFLTLLLGENAALESRKLRDGVILYGIAINDLQKGRTI